MKAALSAALLACLVRHSEGAQQVGQYYFNDCQLARHKNAEFLDRQLAQCGGSGRAMRNLLFGRFGCEDSNHMRYRSGCTTSGVASQVETKYTSCQLLWGERMQFLDRQQLRCSSGYALTDFVVQGCVGGARANYMRYKYHCTKLDDAQSVYTKQTRCDELEGRQVESLERHSLDCGNDFLSAMGVTRSGCSGNLMRYQYECTSSSLSGVPIADLVKRSEDAKQVGQYYFNDCQPARYENAEFLDRQLAQCGGSRRAMRNLLFGQFGCVDSNHMRYRSGCTTSGVASQVETKYTSCQLLRGGRMQFLDRQQLRCSSGYALTDFVVQGCSGKDMRYKYHCTKLDDAQSVYTKQTRCDELEGRQVESLDRHSLDCGNDFLSAMGVTRSGCSGNLMRYQYECTSPVATPLPPSTAVPTASPMADYTAFPNTSDPAEEARKALVLRGVLVACCFVACVFGVKRVVARVRQAYRRSEENTTASHAPDNHPGDDAWVSCLPLLHNASLPAFPPSAPSTDGDVAQEAPPHMVCPISLSVMKDPCRCGDGHHNFERSYLLRHLQTNTPACPLSRIPMTAGDVVPNEELKAEIKEWLRGEDFPPGSSVSFSEPWRHTHEPLTLGCLSPCCMFCAIGVPVLSL